MQLRYLLICEAAGKTEDGRHILHGIFDRTTVNRLADNQALIRFYLAFEVDEVDLSEAHRLKIGLRDSETREFAFETPEQTTEIVIDKKKLMGIARFNGVRIKKFGEYTLVLKVDDEEVGTAQLTVVESGKD